MKKMLIAGRVGWVLAVICAFLLGQKMTLNEHLLEQERRMETILECQIRITDYMLRIHHHVSPNHKKGENKWCPECYDIAHRHHSAHAETMTDENAEDILRGRDGLPATKRSLEQAETHEH